QIQERKRELRGRVIRLLSQRAAEARGRFAMTPESLENNAYVGMVFGSHPTQDRRADETLERLRHPPRRREGDTAVVQHLGGVRPNGKRPIEALERLSIALEVEQRDPALNVRFRVSGQELDCALERRERFLVAAQRDQRRAATDESQRIFL